MKMMYRTAKHAGEIKELAFSALVCRLINQTERPALLLGIA